VAVTGAGIGIVPKSLALRATQVSSIRIVHLSDSWTNRRHILLPQERG
jgi:hypothetical protein